MIRIALIYIVITNAIGFFIMGYDKDKAKKGQWRVPEFNLLFTAAIGGSIGELLGIYVFHHKTKHLKFTLGVPLIIIIQAYLLFKLF